MSAAVAFSGGPDSTALTFLLNDWMKKHGGCLTAFTVNHNLRAEARAEAEKAGAWCRSQNIPHTILNWEKTAQPQSAVQEEARHARYVLLLAACREQNIAHLFLAHHADDQAETVLMRLEKESGIDGIAGMAVKRRSAGVTLGRPLLPVRKAELIEFCREQHLPFAEDPSNDDTRFRRVRLRRASTAFAREGLGVERLYEIAREAGFARAKLEKQANSWLARHGSADAFGVVRIDHAAWLDLPEDIRLRILTRVLLTVGGGDYPPRLASLKYLAGEMHARFFSTRTLGGCLIQKYKGTILITREPEASPQETPFAGVLKDCCWDGRFRIRAALALAGENFSVRPLMLASRADLEKKEAGAVATLPHIIRAALPGIFLGKNLVFVPDFTGSLPQAPVKAEFLPKHPLIIDGFEPPAPLLSLFGVV